MRVLCYKSVHSGRAISDISQDDEELVVILRKLKIETVRDITEDFIQRTEYFLNT